MQARREASRLCRLPLNDLVTHAALVLVHVELKVAKRRDARHVFRRTRHEHRTLRWLVRKASGLLSAAAWADEVATHEDQA
jgi:hypothetical protein